MGNLLQMSITSGQDTDSRQITLAANSHRLAGETYDANGNRTSGTADGFTSVSYNILNLPETVTAGGWTINYLYSAAGAKLRERVILSASEESVTDYAGNTVFRDSVLHKVLTGSGYLETTDSLQTLLSHPGYRFFITDHLGSVRVVADAQGNVLQRNVYHPYGEDYAAVYAQGGNILDGLNIGSNAQPGGEGTPEGEGEPAIDDPEPGASVGGGGPDEPIEDDGEEAAADEAPLARPQYYRSFNPYRFSSKEQMTVYGGSLVGSNFEPNAGLYDFGARWYAPYSARWSTPDPLSEKYYAISPYAYCAGNPVNLVDPTGMAEFWHNGKVIGNDGIDDNRVFVLKTRESYFEDGETRITGAGLSRKKEKAAISFIKKNSGNSEQFLNSDVYDSFIEIEGSKDIRDAMVCIVKQDNAKGGKEAANNREYGGVISDGKVKEVPPGEVSTPNYLSSIVISSSLDEVTFHSHASGDLENPYTKTTYTYIQFPSQADINNAGNKTHYVFGRRDENVYVYNSSGIQAVIPHKYFVEPNR